jgi:protein-disulfide isomerase
MMSRYRGQLAKDDETAQQQVVEALRQRETSRLESEFKDRLVAESGLTVKLDPPRVDVPLDADDPSTGPADAPVTLVEFADYQCPFCTRAQETVKRVRETYGDTVRLVVKQLPLPMHPQARGAAEAALCAQQQGEFWKMHEWLFANRDKLAPEQLKAQAKALGLDAEKFGTCLDSHQEASRVDADLAEASAVGANATPTFFVNGRLVRGAQPFDAVAEIINEELARAGVPVPQAARPQPEPTPATG